MPVRLGISESTRSFIYYSYIGSYNRRDQSSSHSNLDSGWNERGLHGETLGQQSAEPCAAALYSVFLCKE
jgi:hypothetical protein